ncbi:predicted protein [Naegleria gruberi]|uniref:Predicted protein n=1 Tax=Naegleria gruberi TaxID=5762 RepID=D2W481_NAEGR|nr:uncharacterized protein NAEGRDRAFT_76210 [Naegleria gruberi]EFC36135.1 predicted protein [Naegleria gruberi]|eukprot:XP_002668879.1 predicted protein [Naegleria gruberi strain NEG-M]
MGGSIGKEAGKDAAKEVSHAIETSTNKLESLLKNIRNDMKGTVEKSLHELKTCKVWFQKLVDRVGHQALHTVQEAKEMIDDFTAKILLQFSQKLKVLLDKIDNFQHLIETHVTEILNNIALLCSEFSSLVRAVLDKTDQIVDKTIKATQEGLNEMLQQFSQSVELTNNTAKILVQDTNETVWKVANITEGAYRDGMKWLDKVQHLWIYHYLPFIVLLMVLSIISIKFLTPDNLIRLVSSSGVTEIWFLALVTGIHFLVALSWSVFEVKSNY